MFSTGALAHLITLSLLASETISVQRMTSWFLGESGESSTRLIPLIEAQLLSIDYHASASQAAATLSLKAPWLSRVERRGGEWCGVEWCSCLSISEFRVRLTYLLLLITYRMLHPGT